MKRQKLTGFLLSALCVAACVMGPSTTFAQDAATKAQAREQFNQGLAQYESSQYDAALESFQEAYRLSPHPLVRVNMANCYDRLGKPVEALFHFEHFLSETEGDASRAQQRTEVQSAVKRLKRSLGELSLRVIPDGSLVRVDESEERRSPIVEPIRLAAGDHRVVVSRPGFATTERRFVIRGGQTESVNITLDREAAAAIAPVATTTPEPAAINTTTAASGIAPISDDDDDAQDSSTTLTPTPREVATTPSPIPVMPSEPSDQTIFTPPVIIAGVISGTLLIGSALIGLAALKAESDFDGYKAQATNPALSMREQAAARRSANSAANLADSRALAADILLGGALIAGAAAVIFVLTQDDGDDPDVALSIGPSGVGLLAAF